MRRDESKIYIWVGALHALETHLALRMLGSAREAHSPPGKSPSLPRNISVAVCLFLGPEAW